MLSHQNDSPVVAGDAWRPQPRRPLPNGYDDRPSCRKVATALGARASALQAFRVVSPAGGGGGGGAPRIERLVAEAIARVHAVVEELREGKFDALEDELRAGVLACLSPNAGGPDEAA